MSPPFAYRPFKGRSEHFESGVVETPDHAQIYVESRGKGPVLLLLHGWTMSSRFWVRQQEALSKRFRVVTPDFRAHGNSPKTLCGHNIPAYARDVLAIVEALGLEQITLAGWSLAGPVVLECWRAWRGEHIRNLCLVDITPFPMLAEPWNSHFASGYNFRAMHDAFKAVNEDKAAFGRGFIDKMFKSGKAPEMDMAWMLEEYLKTPSQAAIAIYSDYLLRDYMPVLGTLTAPTLVCSADSAIYPRGVSHGRRIAGFIPKSRFLAFENGGHLLFYEDPDRFNNALSDLASSG